MKKHLLHYIKNAACIACMVLLSYGSWRMAMLYNAEWDFSYYMPKGFMAIGIGVAAGLLIVEYVSAKRIPKVWMITLTVVLGFSAIMGIAVPLGHSLVFEYLPVGLYNAFLYFIMSVQSIFGLWLVVVVANIIKSGKKTGPAEVGSEDGEADPEGEGSAAADSPGKDSLKKDKTIWALIAVCAVTAVLIAGLSSLDGNGGKTQIDSFVRDNEDTLRSEIAEEIVKGGEIDSLKTIKGIPGYNYGEFIGIYEGDKKKHEVFFICSDSQMFSKSIEEGFYYSSENVPAAIYDSDEYMDADVKTEINSAGGRTNIDTFISDGDDFIKTHTYRICENFFHYKIEARGEYL